MTNATNLAFQSHMSVSNFLTGQSTCYAVTAEGQTLVVLLTSACLQTNTVALAGETTVAIAEFLLSVAHVKRFSIDLHCSPLTLLSDCLIP